MVCISFGSGNLGDDGGGIVKEAFVVVAHGILETRAPPMQAYSEDIRGKLQKKNSASNRF